MKNRKPKCINEKKISSVLIPLIEVNHEIHILFEVRSKTLIHQPGEICFPGGRKEKGDTSTIDTILREAKEELLIEDQNIEILTPLDYYFSVNGMRIDAYLGKLIDYKYTFNEEVENVFTVPLDYFFNNEPLHIINEIQTIPNPNLPDYLKDYHWAKGESDVCLYQYQDKVIWGITGRILYYNLNNIKEEMR